MALAGAAVYWRTRREETVRYLTVPATRGTVAVALTATGTVNPVTVAEVGTYVSGAIESWYCDYNTPVKVGQLCAQIDPRPFQMVAAQARANLGVAQAQLVKDQANLAYAKTTYERDRGLLQRGIVQWIGGTSMQVMTDGGTVAVDLREADQGSYQSLRAGDRVIVDGVVDTDRSRVIARDIWRDGDGGGLGPQAP